MNGIFRSDFLRVSDADVKTVCPNQIDRRSGPCGNFADQNVDDVVDSRVTGIPRERYMGAIMFTGGVPRVN